ncbi:MAG: right-handed parallel beta-helix repeat-containing protein [Saprospiraceae bacterium]|nr:right-handed parallel beta-helix repeat-containing protein [Bacteroidia bacterium]NNE16322.1 right-handed parallel beta-helix repeat-containing protein [Saprospiraceae bacterium]NNL93944.1 right-handed parallel beta-helix repeat-containing protein [Saprospiraceae bacterium]
MPEKSITYFFVILCGIMISLSACQEEVIATDSNIPLRFSLDTLRFDTVFTQAGSATRFFKIYNDLEETVIINSISLDKPSGSFFRINVDGIQMNAVENIRIEPTDSIYVFAEVTIDPDNPVSISPFFIEENVNFKVNDSDYSVLLEAWGQNANYIPSRESGGTVNYVSCDFGTWTWDDPKPYVLYGVLLIDSCDLVLPPGTEVFVHGGIAINDLGVFNDGLLVLLENGSLVSNGTLEEPVTFQTDRLEMEFEEVQGQWSGILISQGSKGNVLSHTHVRNSIVGVSVDSAASLRIESSIFAYTSGSGLTASHANIYAENSLFYQNGGSGLSLNFGGDYLFNYCTIANYNNQDPALNANNIKCLDADCATVLFNGLRGTFNNCIFTGNDDDEIGFFDISNGEDPFLFNYDFNNCVVTVDELLNADQFPNFFDNCKDCVTATRQDTVFLNVDEDIYSLDTMSVAQNKGSIIPFVTLDILEELRSTTSPDIGCYELID